MEMSGVACRCRLKAGGLWRKTCVSWLRATPLQREGRESGLDIPVGFLDKVEIGLHALGGPFNVLAERAHKPEAFLRLPGCSDFKVERFQGVVEDLPRKRSRPRGTRLFGDGLRSDASTARLNASTSCFSSPGICLDLPRKSWSSG